MTHRTGRSAAVLSLAVSVPVFILIAFFWDPQVLFTSQSTAPGTIVYPPLLALPAAGVAFVLALLVLWPRRNTSAPSGRQIGARRGR